MRHRCETAHLRAVEQRGYEQYGIGSGYTCLIYLVLVDYELLAQQRQVGHRARHLQVGYRAAEIEGVGKYRAARGTPAGVVGHDIAYLRHGRDFAARRRPAFELGYDAELAAHD